MVSDFGSARFVDPLETKARSQTSPTLEAGAKHETPGISVLLFETAITISLSAAYTTRWAAPEILQGETSTLASDVWALGLVCWEVRCPEASIHG